MYKPTMESVEQRARTLCNEVIDEVRAQLAKWGVQNHNVPDWFFILSEEHGEVAKAILEMNPKRGLGGSYAAVRKELLHVASSAVSMIESLDRQAKWIQEAR